MSRKGKGIEAQISAILEDYSDNLVEQARVLGRRIAKECCEEIRENSPRRRPEYYKGWTVDEETSLGGWPTFTIYNKTHPGLTHLLEKGHETSKGRTTAKPHIKPAEEKYNQLYLMAMEEAAENAGNKS